MLCQVAGDAFWTDPLPRFRKSGVQRSPREGGNGESRLEVSAAFDANARADAMWDPPDGLESGLPGLSTGCTECCGNVDYSTFANCGIFLIRPPCSRSEEAIHSLLRRARRGSRTKQHREVVRGGSQGPKRKVDRGCGRNRDRLGEFFLVRLTRSGAFPARLRS